MPPPAAPPKDDRALSAQAAGRLVAGARGPRAAAAPVPDAHRARLREGAAARCLAAPAETVAGEKRFETRDAIVARLARGEACDQPEGVARVLRRAVADKKSRRDGLELGLRVLFELYAREKRGAARDAYDRCLLALLGALRDGLDAEERKLLAEAALGAPRLPDAAIAFLGDLCESPDHVALGLGALRDVATRRPAARDRCLRRALELTRRPDVAPEVREKAVRLATNQLWPNAALRETVVASRARAARDGRARGARGPRRRRRRRAGGGAPGARAGRRAVRQGRVARAGRRAGARRRPPTRPTTRGAPRRARPARRSSPNWRRPSPRSTAPSRRSSTPPTRAGATCRPGGATRPRRSCGRWWPRSRPGAARARPALGGRRRRARAGAAGAGQRRGGRRGGVPDAPRSARRRPRRSRRRCRPCCGGSTTRSSARRSGARCRRTPRARGVPTRALFFFFFSPPVRDAPPGPRAGQGVEVDHGPGGRGPPGEAAPRPGGRRARQAPERGAQRLPEPARRVRAAGAPGRAGPHDAAAGLGRRGARGRAEGVPADVHPGRQDAPGAARRAGRAARAPAAGRRGRLARRGPVEGLPRVRKILGAGAGAGDDACFAAALMLPAPQLQKLLAFAPKLKLPLKRHAEKLVKARDTDGVVAGCLALTLLGL